MRFEDLQVFSVVADCGNLRRAAEKVGLTQSAVTKTLHRLETEFGVPLVERRTRGVVLSAAGTLLLGRAVSLRTAVTDLRAEMLAIKSARSGTVRIGTIPALLETTLMPVLARFLARDPDIRFEVSLQVSSRLIPEVMQGDIDMALCLAPETIPPELQSDNLGKLPFHVVGRSGHPLAHAGFNIGEFAKARWLLPTRDVNNAMRTAIEKRLVAAGYKPPTAVVETDSSVALYASLVRETNLIAPLTDRMLKSQAGRGLVALPFVKTPLTLDLRLLFRRNAFLSPATRKFRSALHALVLQKVK